ncbi:MAG: hypothetical protein IKZ82_08360 [Clostridia bacterium]|nr:hypothetical protein [Clostridia bacterium]
MKRPIIFRGKTACDGSWIKGDLIGISSDFKPVQFIRCSYSEVYKVDPETVGQFTGLHDCENRDIYEGDIIRWADRSYYELYLDSKDNPEDYVEGGFDDLFEYGVVYYAAEECDYPAFDVSNWNHDECNGLSSLAASGEWHFEVIGNIHDNPDMLPDAPARGE